MSYHLILGNAPLCDYLGCQAGRDFSAKTGVDECGHHTLKTARAAVRKVNRTSWAGAVRVVEGSCPRLTD